MKTKKERKHRFLFISRWGDLLDIAHALQQEDNEVKLYIEYKPCREVGDGFVPKARSWEKRVDWADVIIFDYTGYGKIASGR